MQTLVISITNMVLYVCNVNLLSIYLNVYLMLFILQTVVIGRETQCAWFH